MASLPNTPWTDIEDFRVATDAPVSTDLMVDMVVDLNYLKSGIDILAGLTTEIFKTSGAGTWLCPAGVTKVLARMWAGGAGSGAAPSDTGSGGDGTAGGDTWFANSANKARGGLPGHGATTSAHGAGAAAQAPVVGTTLVQYGSLATSAGSASGGVTRGGDGGAPPDPFRFAVPGGSAATGTSSAGTAGAANTGSGAGGSSKNFGGGGGQNGEYAEYEATVVPGVTYNYNVGAKGTGGAADGGGSNPGPAGADGGSGLLELLY